MGSSWKCTYFIGLSKCRVENWIWMNLKNYHILLWHPMVHQQIHVIRNTAHRPSTQASYTASRVRLIRKISCAVAQIAATLTISFPRWRHMSLASYWGKQRMSLTSYPGRLTQDILACIVDVLERDDIFCFGQIRTSFVLQLRETRKETWPQIDLQNISSRTRD